MNNHIVIPAKHSESEARAGIPARRRGRQKTIITEIIDKNSNSALSDITLHDGQYIFLLTDTAADFTDERTITIAENAVVDIFLCYFGSGSVDVKLIYKINRGARVTHKLLFFGSGGQGITINERYEFVAPHAWGRFSVQGLVSGSAQSNCIGNIVVAPRSQRTDSRLEMSAHLLSNAARATMVPSLQIEANDVKAGHAGKVSQLGKEELFYLQSRGLNEQQAKRLFIEGLFLEFVKDIENKKVREEILEMTKKRMGK